MDNNIKFSFIMPAYKKRFLFKAIDSILKQSYINFELIIIDDASPENLIEVIQQFQDSRIIYKNNKINIGRSDLVANWNHCIQFAKNEFIVLATDDDMYETNFLSEAVKIIQKYPYVDIIRSGVKKIDENEEVLDIEFPLKEYMTCREYTLFYAKGGTISCISNFILKKDALTRIGGFISFPHAHYSDDATTLAISKNGIACIPSNEVCFRVSTINLSNRSDFQIVKEQLKATELYMGWYLEHIKRLDINPNDFFERACYGGYKTRYLIMIEKLVGKIPIYKVFIALRIILSIKHLFTKEKIKLIALFLINKM